MTEIEAPIWCGLHTSAPLVIRYKEFNAPFKKHNVWRYACVCAKGEHAGRGIT